MCPTKPGSTTIENHQGVLFLVKEPTRKGVLAWWVRFIIGELDPIRTGPFETEKDARKAFAELVSQFNNHIVDVFPTSHADHER